MLFLLCKYLYILNSTLLVIKLNVIFKDREMLTYVKYMHDTELKKVMKSLRCQFLYETPEDLKMMFLVKSLQKKKASSNYPIKGIKDAIKHRNFSIRSVKKNNIYHSNYYFLLSSEYNEYLMFTELHQHLIM